VGLTCWFVSGAARICALSRSRSLRGRGLRAHGEDCVRGDGGADRARLPARGPDANKRAIEAAGLSFILGTKIPGRPYVVTDWRPREAKHPDQEPPDGLILTLWGARSRAWVADQR